MYSLPIPWINLRGFWLEQAGFRVSTEGATLRVHLEQFEPDPERHQLDTQAVLGDLIKLAEGFTEIKQRTGRDASTVIT